MRSEIDRIRKEGRDDTEWKMRYENLDRTHQVLQNDLRQQQKITTEVKQEASDFLREMRLLSERSSEHSEREERLLGHVHQLEEEVNQWKSKYIQAKGQARAMNAPSIDANLQRLHIGQTAGDRGYFDQDGLITFTHVTKLQVAIDELLRSARSRESQSLAAYVRSILVYAREVIQDAQHGNASNEDRAQKIKKCSMTISDTANNLVIAVRNFSSANGLSPISFVDAAASHLMNSVISLAAVAKIKPNIPGDLDDEDDNSFIAESPATYYGLHQYGRSSTGDSIYSSMSPIQQQGRQSSNHQVSKNSSIYKSPPYQNGLPNGTSHSEHPQPGLGINSQLEEVEELKVG